MNKTSVILIPLILISIYYTWDYDELLLNRGSMDHDIFVSIAKQYPLLVSYILISIIIILVLVTCRRYLKRYTDSSIASYFFLTLFFISFLPSNPAAGILLIPFYLQSLFFIILIVLLHFSIKSKFVFLNRSINYIFTSDRKIFLAAVFILNLTITNIISLYVFKHIPHIEDSISYLFQAKIFSRGLVYTTAPRFPEFFRFQHIIMHDNKWYSQYGPGHPLMLAIGTLIQMPWLINPLINAITSIVIYFLALEIYDEKTARIAAILSLFSPFLLFMSSEYMSHTTCLFFISLFLLFFMRTLKYEKWRHPAIAGIALGYAINIRQITGFLVLISAGGYLIYLTFKRKVTLKKDIIFLIGAALPVLFLFYYNFTVNDDPFIFRYIGKTAGISPKNYGFGLEKNFTFFNALQHTIDRLNLLNIFLFEWPMPSFTFAAAALCSRNRKGFEIFLFLIPVTISAAYFSREYMEICFGPRYLYETSVVYILLSSRGIADFCAFLKNISKVDHDGYKLINIRNYVFILLIGFCLFYKFPKLVRIYSNSYWRVDEKLHNMALERNINNAIIFIEDKNDDWNKPFLWGAGFQWNSPFLDNRVIYAKNKDKNNLKLMAYYPDKDYYISFFDPAEKKISLMKITRSLYK